MAGFFNDNGSGQRGSLWAMVKAVLLDPEARNAPSDPTYGKLKEPAQYILNVLRAFDAKSANRAAPSDGYINTPYSRDMGEEVFRAEHGLLATSRRTTTRRPPRPASSVPSSASWTPRRRSSAPTS